MEGIQDSLTPLAGCVVEEVVSSLISEGSIEVRTVPVVNEHCGLLSDGLSCVSSLWPSLTEPQ